MIESGAWYCFKQIKIEIDSVVYRAITAARNGGTVRLKGIYKQNIIS